MNAENKSSLAKMGIVPSRYNEVFEKEAEIIAKNGGIYSETEFGTKEITFQKKTYSVCIDSDNMSKKEYIDRCEAEDIYNRTGIK